MSRAVYLPAVQVAQGQTAAEVECLASFRIANAVEGALDLG